jgi:ABC-2 type transport system permease protein
MTVELATFPRVTGFAPVQYAICLKGIVWREGLRFLHQRERFVASLVRPLVAPQVQLESGNRRLMTG